MKMIEGPYIKVGVDPEKMSPLPRLVCYTSVFLVLSSITAASVYIASSSDFSLGVFMGLGFFACIALVSGLISGRYYEEQKSNVGMREYRTEKGKFYNRVVIASAGVAGSSIVSSIPLFLNSSLDAFCGAMALACLAEGVGYASTELCDYANSYKPQRRAVGSLDESRGRESTGFVSKLRNFNLIGSFKGTREDSDTLELLKKFNKEEEGYEDSMRRRVLLNNYSNPGYGAIKTTTVL